MPLISIETTIELSNSPRPSPEGRQVKETVLQLNTVSLKLYILYFFRYDYTECHEKLGYSIYSTVYHNIHWSFYKHNGPERNMCLFSNPKMLGHAHKEMNGTE